MRPWIGYEEFGKLFMSAWWDDEKAETYEETFGLTPRETFHLWLETCAHVGFIKPKDFLIYLYLINEPGVDKYIDRKIKEYDSEWVVVYNDSK